MNNLKNIDIFIENTYENFAQLPDLAVVTKDAVEMVNNFLDNEEWVKNSCLNSYDFDLLYFDIVLCDDEKIHEINREYRQKDSPTDVITFAIFADSSPEERFIFDNEINLGEIIISLDRTLAQSQDLQHGNNSFNKELYFLIAHGILHLLGYDHQDEDSLMKMWNIQQEMITPKS